MTRYGKHKCKNELNTQGVTQEGATERELDSKAIGNQEQNRAK